VGYQLKLAQRKLLLARNIRLMTWTFDPLQARNARFNLRKLGALCNVYYRNHYGDMRDGLNQGLPSDRLRADWWLDTERVITRLTGVFEATAFAAGCPVLNQAVVAANGLLTAPDTWVDPAGDFCRVEIPPDIDILKARDAELAIAWRLQTRSIFENAFAANYTLVDFVHSAGRCYYLLQKN
jgi:predicted GNAT superfamily acetyltransferase